MKTLKLFALIIISMLLRQHVNAQDPCGIINISPLHLGLDSIRVSAVNLASAADSAAAVLIVDYGDGATDTLAGFDTSLVHGYANEQEYIVCLTYISPGCTSTHCDTINALRCPPQALTVSQIYPATGTVRFQVNIPYFAAYSYSWNFGANATPNTATGQVAIASFTGTGLYSGSVDVTIGGCTQTVPFVVNMQGCDAEIDETTIDGLNLTAIAVADTNMYYTWLADGRNIASGVEIDYMLNDIKPYELCLATTTAACRDTACTTVTPTPGQDSIYGHVYKDGDAACDVTIYLMEQVSPGIVTAIDSAYPVYSYNPGLQSSCVGTYIMAVPNGNYFLLAAPLPWGADYIYYAPTYYSDDTLLVNATAITNDSTGDLVINLVSRLPQDTTATSIEGKGNIQLTTLYPNPTNDKAVLSIVAKQSGIATLHIADVTGRIVQTTTANLAAGSNELNIDMSSHANGLYYLTINNGSAKHTLKLLKAR